MKSRCILAGLLLLVSCTNRDTVQLSSVNPLHIHGHYAVEFNGETGSVRYFAQFRVGSSTGTTVQLDSPSEVLVDGKPLIESRSPLVGTYYAFEEPMDELQSSYQFMWKLLDGSQVKNRVFSAAPVSIQAPTPSSSHSRTEDLGISFSGDPARSGNWVYGYLEGIDPDSGTEATVTIGSMLSGNWLGIPHDKLRKFPLGTARLWVLRERRNEPSEGHSDAGGLIRSTYRSPSIQIDIVH